MNIVASKFGANASHKVELSVSISNLSCENTFYVIWKYMWKYIAWWYFCCHYGQWLIKTIEITLSDFINWREFESLRPFMAFIVIYIKYNNNCNNNDNSSNNAFLYLSDDNRVGGC